MQRSPLDTAIHALAESYREVYQSLALDDRRRLSAIVSEAMSGLDAGDARSESQSAALGLLTELLSSPRRRDVVILESPAWLTPAALDSLQREAAAQKAGAIRVASSWYSDVQSAPYDLLLTNSDFLAWVHARLDIVPNGFANELAAGYLYYDTAGDRFSPHVDNPETHSINCLVCLKHTLPRDQPPSSLRLYDGSGDHQDVVIGVGEAVLFEAACTPHARTPLGPGEQITLLNIGLRYADA